MQKFVKAGRIGDRVSSVHNHDKCWAENTAAVNDNLVANLEFSIRLHSDSFGYSYGSILQLLQRNLQLHPYKILLIQELKLRDHGRLIIYAEGA